MAAPPEPNTPPANAAANAAKAANTIQRKADLARPNSVTSAIALRRQADHSMQIGEFDEAARTYARAALYTPTDPVLRLLTGVALATIRQPEAATKQFQQACRLTDDDLIASLLLQGALNECGNTDAAQTVYLDAVRRYGRRDNSGGLDASGSLTLLKRALSSAPDSPILYLLQGDAYQIGEDWTKADSAYRKAILLAPRWIKPKINLGLSRLAQDHPAEAIAIFEQALARDPENVQLLFYRADAERQAGNLPAAISSYQHIQNRSTGRSQSAVTAQALTGLGQAYAAGGRYDDAVDALTKARQIAPSDPAPPTALADIQTKRREFSAAAVSYDAALRLTKANGLFGTQVILYQALAQTQISGRQFDAALATLTRAMGDEPGSMAIWQQLRGEALLNSGDATGAETAFKASLNVQTDTGIFPQETLAAIASHRLLERIASSYLADISEVQTGVRVDTPATGVAIVNGHSAQARPTMEATAHAALAAIAQYRGDVHGETEQREALTHLRSRAADWLALAEAYDQRARDPERARLAYAKALNLGGLSEAQASRARAKALLRNPSDNTAKPATPSQ